MSQIISRRRIAQGGSWALPAVVLASAALSAFGIGGTGQPGLVLHQSKYSDYYNQTEGYQTVTFSFSEPLSTIDFSITDIDWTAGGFRDAVYLSSNMTMTPTSTLSPVTTSGVTWYQAAAEGLTDNASEASNLGVSGQDIITFKISCANLDRAWDSNGDGVPVSRSGFISEALSWAIDQEERALLAQEGPLRAEGLQAPGLQ